MQLGDLPDVSRVLVGTMVDLSDQRQVTTAQVSVVGLSFLDLLWLSFSFRHRTHIFLNRDWNNFFGKGRALAESWAVPFIECSAKENANIGKSGCTFTVKFWTSCSAYRLHHALCP
jgi:hypothetical protein